MASSPTVSSPALSPLPAPVHPPDQKAEIPSLFERYHLGNCFPKEKYLEASKKSGADPKIKGEVAPYILHYLFALNATLDSIRNFMKDKTKGDIQKRINTKDPQYGLTCLHITVIRGNFDGTREVIQRGADVNAKDNYGFTPWLHTALLIEGAAIKKLLEDHRAEKDEEKWKLLRKSGGFEQETRQLQTCFYQNEKEERVPLTLKDWTTTLKMENYTDGVVFSPTEHRHLWRLFFEHSFSTERLLFERFSKKTSRYVPLIVQSSLGTLPGADSQRVKGLYLGEAVKRGDFIGWYGARATVLPAEPELYRWQLLEAFQEIALQGDIKKDYFAQIDDLDKVTADAGAVGNVMRFANDGWPQILVFRFPGPRLGMFASQPIEANVELTWDYGLRNPRLKWGYYKLLHKLEISKFFKQGNLSQWLSKIEHAKSKLNASSFINIEQYKQKVLESRDWEAKLSFIFETPLALIYLCLSDTLKASEVVEILYSNSKIFELLEIDDPLNSPHYVWLFQTLILLKHIEQCIQKIPGDEIIPKLKSFFVEEIIDHFSVIQVVKGLVFLRSALNDKALVEKNWGNFKSEIKEKLEGYSLEKDDKPALAFVNKNKDIIIVFEEESEKLLYKLKMLESINNASTNTEIETRTHKWGECYKIRRYSAWELAPNSK